ncbi:MAG: FAD-binding oxidoreductase [Limibacillus sp.]|jgi:FAD/FMN-containing dehydrogenase
MPDVSISTISGGACSLSQEDIDSLQSALRGSVALPGDPSYDEARTLWNAMIDRSPGLVVRCAGAADVRLAVLLANERGLEVAVRSGGHNISGKAVCDEGLLIDLSTMTSVRVDPKTRKAWVEPGALLGDLDKEAQAHALATPLGVNSTTGVAGLTLGGGFGWITRKYGMSIDNLISAEVVTAKGEILRASESENSDLFWALRGGGGNFGIVTGFEFQLHPVGPEVLSGLIVHPLEDAKTLLPAFRDAAKAAPDELTIWSILRKAPPLPFLPEEWHGKEVLVFALCYCGDMAEGEKAVSTIRSLGAPIADVVGPHPFVGWQAAFDPLLEPGARNYWKSHDFLDLSDEAIDTLLTAVKNLPTPECEVFIAHVGGAMSRVPTNATAYPQRASHFIMNVHTRWRDPSEDTACIDWARDLFNKTAPFAIGTVYINFMPDDEDDRVVDAYGDNYSKLMEVKKKYDPENLFRMNQNITPS